MCGERKVRCKNCGWGYGVISRAAAQFAVDEFNAYYNTLSYDEQARLYGGNPSSIDLYERCGRCGSYEFEETDNGYMPKGATYSFVIFEERKSDR